VHYWADLQSVHGLRCYGNITRTRNVSEYMLVLALCLVCFCCVRFSFFNTTPTDWLGRTSSKWPILCRVGCKTITQSIDQSPPGMSVRSLISNTTRPNFTKFSVRVNYGRSSVLRWQQCNTLCTTGHVDDVIFGHNRPGIGQFDANMACTQSDSLGGNTGATSDVYDWHALFIYVTDFTDHEMWRSDAFRAQV